MRFRPLCATRSRYRCGDATTLDGEEGTQPIEPSFRTLADTDADVPEASSDPVWTWVGDGEKPILCDHLEDGSSKVLAFDASGSDERNIQLREMGMAGIREGGLDRHRSLSVGRQV